jgi:hypothetical protein
MKQIITFENGVVVGPFDTIEKVDNGYIADNTSYQTNVTGEVVITEVDDDYVNPDSIKQPPKLATTIEELQAQIDELKKGAV